MSISVVQGERNSARARMPENTTSAIQSYTGAGGVTGSMDIDDTRNPQWTFLFDIVGPKFCAKISYSAVENTENFSTCAYPAFSDRFPFFLCVSDVNK
eukprot:g82652.t1